MNPSMRVTLNKGRHGVSLGKLSNVAKGIVNFLQSLSEDLDMESDGEKWIAEDFTNSSVIFGVGNPEIVGNKFQVWRQGLRAVMACDNSDEDMNVRITQRTRAQYFEIASKIDPDEIVEFAIYSTDKNVDPSDIFELDRSKAAGFEEKSAKRYFYHGEIQGSAHSFFKEAAKPYLVVRELSTRNLVKCYFKREMYEHVVALLEDKNAVLFIEGDVTEDAETGAVESVSAIDFTPAPKFDEGEFEKSAGTFKGALTGQKDAAIAVDEYRDSE